MNIPRLLLITAAAACSFLGCNRSGEKPPTGFRLTLQDIVTDSNARVALVTVKTAGGETILVTEDRGRNSASLPEPEGNRLREGSVVLMGSRIAPKEEGNAYIQTLIRVQTGNGSAGGPSMYPLPSSTEFADHFTITAKSGDYPLNMPIEIARLGGKPVTLSVTKSPK